MKEVFETAMLEIIVFEKEDVIRTSGGDELPDDMDPFNLIHSSNDGDPDNLIA